MPEPRIFPVNLDTLENVLLDAKQAHAAAVRRYDASLLVPKPAARTDAGDSADFATVAAELVETRRARAAVTRALHRYGGAVDLARALGLVDEAGEPIAPEAAPTPAPVA